MQILVIDDDETFCRLLVEILEETGMQAAWTTNGLTGYEMMTRDDYELCIIDVRMPLVLGTDLAEAIREDITAEVLARFTRCTGYIGGKINFIAPRGTAVRRCTEVHIPAIHAAVGGGTRVHPGNADVPVACRGNRREVVMRALGCGGNILF